MKDSMGLRHARRLPLGKRSVANQASAFATDNNKDFAHDLDLVLVR